MLPGIRTHIFVSFPHDFRVATLFQIHSYCTILRQKSQALFKNSSAVTILISPLPAAESTNC